MGDRPDLDQPEALAQFIQRTSTQALVVIMIDTFLMAAMIVLLAGFRQIITHARRDLQWVADLGFGAGLVFVTVTLIGDALNGGAALDTVGMEPDPSAIRALTEGYTLMSTMHADDVQGVISQLIDECDVPRKNIGHLAFVVPLYVGAHQGRRVRRVSEVAVLEPLGDAFDQHSAATWRPEDDTFDVLSTPAAINAAARRLGMSDEEFLGEVGRREALLQSLIDDEVGEIDEVQRRVLEFSGYQLVE